METVEKEVVVAVAVSLPHHNNDNGLSTPVAKGKRTKRQRPYSPIPFTVNNNDIHNRRLSPSLSAASAAAESAAMEEEEDTARCLILLSRGHVLHNETSQQSDQYSKQNNRRRQTAGASAGGGAYACKTCNRVFSSFQALGGHRTSHKKPKNDKKTDFDNDFASPSSSKKRIPPSLSLQLSSGDSAAGGRSPRIHECSYCGAEFASGQALGGHMRRHRAGPTSPLPVEARPPDPKRPRNGLGLDLNFPAPEDERQRFRYGGGGGQLEKSQEKMVISAAAPALVDCHY